MNWTSWLIWGFAATAVLTTLMAGSEGFGITRMNIPHMLGTMFTPNRDRAKVYGVGLHFLNGWVFSILYVAAFHSAHIYTWWFGMVLGLAHGLFVVAVMAPVMPGIHPRMASELRGPTVARQLEPPGFLALNYGARTPISVVIAHLAFGAILGGLYSPSGSSSNGARRAGTSSLVTPQVGVHSPRACSGNGPGSAAASVTSNTTRHWPPREQNADRVSSIQNGRRAEAPAIARTAAPFGSRAS
jgi:hypothetical protein